jgi:hypothetical protein
MVQTVTLQSCNLRCSGGDKMAAVQCLQQHKPAAMLDHRSNSQVAPKTAFWVP